MTAEPTYEYRIIDRRDSEFGMPSIEEARKRAPEWNTEDPGGAPHRIQRRLVTPWEDVPEGGTDDQ